MNEVKNIPLTKDISICNQVNCKYREHGCRECSACKSGPSIVTNNCARCWKCVNIPGELRWGEELTIEENEAIEEPEQGIFDIPDYPKIYIEVVKK